MVTKKPNSGFYKELYACILHQSHLLNLITHFFKNLKRDLLSNSDQGSCGQALCVYTSKSLCKYEYST